jgi:hypothetical protein
MKTEATASSMPPDTIFLTPLARKAWDLLQREIATYRRELPRLLQEGQGNRHALIKDDEILGTWEKYEEASQAGHDRFGLDTPFLVQKIDPRDPERFVQLDARIAAECRR